MAFLESLFAWLETTALARAVGESLSVTAWLSAIHLIGFTLVMGSAVLANLKLHGALLPQRTTAEVVGPASRAIVLGLIVSIATGVLLFSGRATTASTNGTFQLKMLLLVAAVVFHFTMSARVAKRLEARTHVRRLTAILGLSLWISLALTACAFILFE